MVGFNADISLVQGEDKWAVHMRGRLAASRYTYFHAIPTPNFFDRQKRIIIAAGIAGATDDRICLKLEHRMRCEVEAACEVVPIAWKQQDTTSTSLLEGFTSTTNGRSVSRHTVTHCTVFCHVEHALRGSRQ